MTGSRQRALSPLANLITVAVVLLTVPVFWMLLGVFFHEGKPSFEHFAFAFNNPSRLLRLAGHSAVVVIGSVGGAFALGLPLGFLCFRTDLPGRGAIVALMVVALGIPLYVTGSAWLTIGGTTFWFYKLISVIWVQMFAYTPYACLLSGLALSASDPELDDQAQTEGNLRQRLRYIVWPQCRLGLSLSVTLLAILALSDITVTDMFMVRTWPEEIFSQWQLGASPWQATATAYPLAALVAVLLLTIVVKLQHAGVVTTFGFNERPRPTPLGRWRVAATVLAWGLTLFLLVLPTLALLYKIGSLEAFWQGVVNVRREILTVALTVPLAATVAAIVGLAAAWVLTHKGWGRWLVATCLLLLFVVPGPVLGVGVIYSFNRPGVLGMIYDSPMILVLVYVLRGLPIASLILYPALVRIPKDLRDAVRLDGGDGMGYFWRFLTPLVWRWLLIAWLLVFMIAIADVGASFLVVPPGWTTLSVRFFNLIHYGVYPYVAVMSVIIMLGSAIPAVLIAKLLGLFAQSNGSAQKHTC